MAQASATATAPPTADNNNTAAAATAGDKPTDKAPDVVLRNGGITKHILRPGTGEATPPEGADVEVHYTGRLLDGSKFDSSRDRNDTFTFKIGRGQVIKGWDEGVATMRKGELALLTCKAEYAYGSGGSPPKIPPNATLQFEVELFGWTKKQKVTDDKQVWKEIEVEGEGWNKPNEGAKVTLRWRGRVVGGGDGPATAAGAYFADHYAQPQTITLGADPSFTEGFEESVKNMLKGETSRFTVKPSYGYGDKGNAELKIPPHAEIEYDIALLDFEKGKESFELSNDEKIAFGVAKKVAGNELYKRGELTRAAKRYTAAVALFKYDKQYDAAQMQQINDLKVACSSNLSAVKHKLKDFKAAEEACTEVLALDPKHLKCLFRRAQCLAHRNEFEAALRDLNVAKSVEPKNADVVKLWTAVEARVSAARAKERSMWAGAFGKVNLVTASEEKAAAAKRAADAKKRAHDGGDSDGDGDDAATASASAAAGSAAAASAPTGPEAAAARAAAETTAAAAPAAAPAATAPAPAAAAAADSTKA